MIVKHVLCEWNKRVAPIDLLRRLEGFCRGDRAP
jgi:hypothetical protein